MICDWKMVTNFQGWFFFCDKIQRSVGSSITFISLCAQFCNCSWIVNLAFSLNAEWWMWVFKFGDNLICINKHYCIRNEWKQHASKHSLGVSVYCLNFIRPSWMNNKYRPINTCPHYPVLFFPIFLTISKAQTHPPIYFRIYDCVSGPLALDFG